ncbi:MAG TPA: SAM-dependent methyltransferase [Cyanothece sp. UBA12306]|nr:SAM-dependent methyltransferase [Cyanothece sp. UBA12306]
MKYSIQNHYQNLAHKYNNFWGYSPEFIDSLTKKIIEYLKLTDTDKLVDLGCGTGLYTQAIVSKISFKHPVICVDPSDQMIEQIPKNSQYKTLVNDAVNFADEPGQYNKILIKEMIHHIDDKEKLLKGLFERLTPEGILLLILLPPTIEYPLFVDALRTYEAVQPNYNNLVDLFTKIGFQTIVNFVDYPVSIPKGKYFEMVQNRYMSLLSRFDDEQLKKGLIEMQEKYHDQSNLEFCDRFVFLSAIKPK